MTSPRELDLADVLAARQRIAPYLRPTPLFRYPALDAVTGACTWVKHVRTWATQKASRWVGASGRHGAAAQLSHPPEELAVERLLLGLDDHLNRAPAHGPGLGQYLVQRHVIFTTSMPLMDS